MRKIVSKILEVRWPGAIHAANISAPSRYWLAVLILSGVRGAIGKRRSALTVLRTVLPLAGVNASGIIIVSAKAVCHAFAICFTTVCHVASLSRVAVVSKCRLAASVVAGRAYPRRAYTHTSDG